MSRRYKTNEYTREFNNKVFHGVEIWPSIPKDASTIHNTLIETFKHNLNEYTLQDDQRVTAISNHQIGSYIGRGYVYTFYHKNTPVEHKVNVPGIGHLELMLAKKKDKVPHKELGDHSSRFDYEGKFFHTDYRYADTAEVRVTETSENEAYLSLLFMQKEEFSEHEGVREIKAIAQAVIDTYRPHFMSYVSHFLNPRKNL